MKRVNIHEVKSKLSEYVREVEAGETVVICRRNVPVAELHPVETVRMQKERPIGLGRGVFRVPESFFDDLPEELIENFSGD